MGSMALKAINMEFRDMNVPGPDSLKAALPTVTI
jgi:hypothetical protein